MKCGGYSDGQDSVLTCISHQSGSLVNVELLHEVRAMAVDGAETDMELPGDFAA